MTATVHGQDGLRSAVLPELNLSQPASEPIDYFRATPDSYRPRPPWSRHRLWPGGVLVLGDLVPVLPDPADEFGTRPSDAGQEPGFLRLHVTPLTTEVFVDGRPAGKAVDFGNASGRPISAGTRRIELRSPAGEVASIDLRIVPGELVAYDAAMTLVPPPPPRAVPEEANTIYVINGCYAGNALPHPNRVPPNCDLTKVRVMRK